MILPVQCRVCGDPGRWRPAKHNMLCDQCDASTPPKMSREEFDVAYWGDPSNCPSATRREFYQDYLASPLQFDSYVASTTS